ncbi:hypothetical protein BKA62DRAFT_715547 [Auriculariales sp. MPI-PUGE-AT-0066]|nr:hypothetical protein BKA62DRAFT_715547 [Auriculariales sp. MPI-PUGE-AT-0066]
MPAVSQPPVPRTQASTRPRHVVLAAARRYATQLVPSAVGKVTRNQGSRTVSHTAHRNTTSLRANDSTGSARAEAATSSDSQRSGLPTLCPICFYLFVVRDLNRNVEDVLQDPSCHSFWDACAFTVARERVHTEVDALERSLCSNLKRCTAGSREHALALGILLGPSGVLAVSNTIATTAQLQPPQTRRSPPTGVASLSPERLALAGRLKLVPILMEALLGAIERSFIMRDDVVAERKRADREGKSFAHSDGSWPVTPRQILPYGAEVSARGYIVWACTSQAPRSLSAVATLLCRAFPLVWPILRDDAGLRSSIVDKLNRILYKTQCQWEPHEFNGSSTATSAYHRLTANSTSTAPLLESSHSDASYAACCALTFLEAVSSHPAFAPTSIEEFISGPGIALTLLPTIHGLFFHPIVREDYTVRNVLGKWIDAILWRLNVDASSRPKEKAPLLDHRVTAHLEQMRYSSRRSTLSLAEICAFALYQHTSTRECLGPGCLAPILDIDDGYTRRLHCGRCKLARYCSKDCQERDWRSEVPVPCRRVPKINGILTPVAASETGQSVSHKALCALLRDGRWTPNTMSTFVSTFETGGALHDRLDVLIQWTAARGRLSGRFRDRFERLLDERQQPA